MFGEILFEKPQKLQRMYELINVLAPSSSQFLIAAIFLVDCKGVKLAKITQINQLFSFLNLICINGHIFYGLTRTIMSKNINNDVTMNPPIKALHFLGEELIHV